MNNLFLAELKNLLNNEFPNREVISIKQIPNALTTIAYEVEFPEITYIVKIGFDERDIAKGKGEKEKAAISIANKLLGTKASPKVSYYFKECEGFPGYVTFLDKLDGKILNENEFNIVASSDDNINLLVKLLTKLHSYKSAEFDELNPSKKILLPEYFKSNFQDIAIAIKQNGLLNILDKNLNMLPKIFEYFKDYKDFSFIHGDVNFKNVLMENEKISALIDWDRSLIAPIAFEFAHVSTLAEKYGVSKWHKTLIERYLNSFEGNAEKLYSEFQLVEYFIYFKLLYRKLTHKHQRNAVEVCTETGEELKDHFIRKILEYKLPI